MPGETARTPEQAMHKQLPKTKSTHWRESLHRTMEAINNQNDTFVYELFALSEEELRIVGGAQ